MMEQSTGHVQVKNAMLCAYASLKKGEKSHFFCVQYPHLHRGTLKVFNWLTAPLVSVVCVCEPQKV